MTKRPIAGWIVAFTCMILSISQRVTAMADVLETIEPNQVFYGLKESETENEIIFRVRVYSGKTEQRSFKKANLKSLIQTVKPNEWSGPTVATAEEQFQYCERLATMTTDLEVEWLLEQQLTQLLDRELDPELEGAVKRLFLSSVRIGYRRHKIQIDMLQESQAHLPWVNDDWQYDFVRRLSLEDRGKLQETIATCRNEAGWQVGWGELAIKLENVVAPEVLRRVEGLFAAMSSGPFPKDLLRLELLAEGIARENLPPPNWPRD